MFEVRGRHLPYKLTYSAAAAVGALAIASTISGGNPKRTFSGMTSSSLTLANPLVPKKFTTSSTKHSGGSTSRQCYGLHAFKPLWFDVAAAVNQMRTRA